MADRFYVPAVGDSDLVRLEGDEAHHMARVCRVDPGDLVTVFDGSGIECGAEVVERSRGKVVLRVRDRHRIDREVPGSLTLACSPPKGDRWRWLVEKATELGVTRLVPLITEHGGERVRGVAPEKHVRWVVEASKQCGRNVLMQLAAPTSAREYFCSLRPGQLGLVADPAGRPLRAIAPPAEQQGVWMAVGPEGGFTERELEFAVERGWERCGLGPRILRVETAALALSAAWSLAQL